MRPDIPAQIPTPRRTDHLPTVLAREEVEWLPKAGGDLKLRTALMTIYSAGLRISEAMRLTAQDIDSARMVICVRQGKGSKDRYTVLSNQLLGILRDYWRGAGWSGLDPMMLGKGNQTRCERIVALASLASGFLPVKSRWPAGAVQTWRANVAELRASRKVADGRGSSSLRAQSP